MGVFASEEVALPSSLTGVLDAFETDEHVLGSQTAAEHDLPLSKASSCADNGPKSQSLMNTQSVRIENE
jgi:hypothetical protein